MDTYPGSGDVAAGVIHRGEVDPGVAVLGRELERTIEESLGLVELTLVEIRRVEYFEVELEVLEDHARPARRHGASVLIPKPDLHRLELQRSQPWCKTEDAR